jgi:osomolarity two-component system sensor histidine kinase SLN1
MTVVADASSLIDVIQSRDGLGETGMVLLVGPNRRVSKTRKGDEETTIKRCPFLGISRTMLIAPSQQENQFKYVDKPATPTHSSNLTELDAATVKYVFPPYNTTTQDRHSVYNANLR